MPDVDELVKQFKAVVGPDVADVDARRVLNLVSYDLPLAINSVAAKPVPIDDSQGNDSDVVDLINTPERPKRASMPAAPARVAVSSDGASPEPERWMHVGAFVCAFTSSMRGPSPIRHGAHLELFRDLPDSLKQRAAAGKSKGAAGKPARRRKPKTTVDNFLKVGQMVGSDRRVYGRLSVPLAHALSPVLDTGLFRITASAVSPPPQWRLFCEVPMHVSVSVHSAVFDLFTPAAEAWSCDKPSPLALAAAPPAQQALQQSHLSLHNLREHVFCITHSAALGDVPLLAPSPSGVQPTATDAASGAAASGPGSADGDEGGAQLQADQADALLSQSSTDVAASAAVVATPQLMREHLQLREYQQQALAWMLQREGRSTDGRLLEEELVSPKDGTSEFSHPMWQRHHLTQLPDAPSAAAAEQEHDEAQGPQVAAYFNPFSKRMALQPPARLHACSGGILADEMGLGKTIEVLALVAQAHGHRSTGTPHGSEGSGVESLPAGGTLIVAPLSVVRQWVGEVVRFTGGQLRVLEHYGQGRCSSASHMAKCFDVVVTSYGTLKSELLGGARSAGSLSGSGPVQGGLYGVRWDRVVLDEAHEIRNRSTDMAKACYALCSWHKWCLTGTPLQNSLDDLFSLLHFLQHEPWCEAAWWKKNVADPFAAGDVGAVASVRRVLGPIMLRRTKDMRGADGQPIVQLPPRHVQVVQLDMTPEERVFYDALYARSQLQFEGYMSKGVVTHKYAAMLTLLLRLRQACNHPLLVLGTTKQASGTVDNSASAAPAAPEEGPSEAGGAGGTEGLPADMLQRLYAKFSAGADAASGDTEEAADTSGSLGHLPSFVGDVMRELRRSGTANMECPVCMMAPEGAVVATCCAKVFCRACLDESFKYLKQRLCPFCRRQLGEEDMLPVGAPAPAPKAHAAALASLDALRKAWLPSSKSTAIVGVLSALQRLNNRILELDAADMQGGQGGVQPDSGPAAGQLSLSFTTHTPSGGQKRSVSRATAAPSASRKAARTASAGGSPPPAGPPEVDTSEADALLGHACSSTSVTKAVLFSQWTSMLDLLEIPLGAAGVTSRRIDGSMSQAAREKAVHAFKTRSDVTVLLMSTKAAALGLNLTEANVALVMEPWFNPQVEEQAIGRVWRLGATRDVVVKRYIMRSTVEETMLQLQEKKAAMAKSALAAGDGAAGKLSVQDLIMFFRANKA